MSQNGGRLASVNKVLAVPVAVLAFTLAVAAAADSASAPPSLVTAEAPCTGGNPWVEGNLEGTSPDTLQDPPWVVSDNLFGPLFSSLCNLDNSLCTDGEGPRGSGKSWIWFGGNDISGTFQQIDTAEQTIVFPAGAASVILHFYLNIGYVTSPFDDTLDVQVDGVTQQSYLEPSQKEIGYTLRSIDLTQFADGNSHVIRFYYAQKVSGSMNRADFNVDDVSLDITCAPLAPTALAVDSAGNGVLEPGELASVQPTWKNTGGAPTLLTGDSSNFIGPSGPTYDNPDASASYGTIGAGTSVQCSDCYTVQVTAVDRPAAHWDATIDETAGAATKTWTLHVGDELRGRSCAGPPYYPFIETILHNGVTSGCENRSFCPNDPTLRYQMAVFVLAAKEGPSYQPPICTPPGTFPDVPCPGGPAVDSIEEAHARGIVSGLPDGTYAPYLPVSRAQMAVFLLATAGITPPACTPPGIFSDVPCPGGYTNFIEALYDLGITAGCPGPTLQYCPSDPTKRNQMAVFLTATFHLVLYGP